MTDVVPRKSSYPILPPATRVRIHNRLERTRDAVNELLTSARDNAAALEAAAEELDRRRGAALGSASGGERV